MGLGEAQERKITLLDQVQRAKVQLGEGPLPLIHTLVEVVAEPLLLEPLALEMVDLVELEQHPQ